MDHVGRRPSPGSHRSAGRWPPCVCGFAHVGCRERAFAVVPCSRLGRFGRAKDSGSVDPFVRGEGSWCGFVSRTVWVESRGPVSPAASSAGAEARLVRPGSVSGGAAATGTAQTARSAGSRDESEESAVSPRALRSPRRVRAGAVRWEGQKGVLKAHRKRPSASLSGRRAGGSDRASGAGGRCGGRAGRRHWPATPAGGETHRRSSEDLSLWNECPEAVETFAFR